MSYIYRTGFNGCGQYGAGGILSGSGSQPVKLHMSEAVTDNDVDLITLYAGAGSSAADGADLDVLIDQVTVAHFEYKATNYAAPQKILDRYPLKKNSLLFVQGSVNTTFSGFVHQIRESAPVEPVLGSTAAYLTASSVNNNYNSRTHEIIRFDYTSKTSALLSKTVPASVLDGERGACSGATDSTNGAGYYVGGQWSYQAFTSSGERWSSGNVPNNNSKKITFSNETVSTVNTTLTGTGGRECAVTQSTTIAHFIGGYDATGSESNRIDKMTFNTESIAVGSTLATSRTNIINSTASKSTDGYIFGGFTNPNALNTVRKISHSTSSDSAVGSTFFGGNVTRYNTTVQDTTYAYVKWGANTAADPWGILTRFSLSAETEAALYITQALWSGFGGTRESKSNLGYFFGLTVLCPQTGGLNMELDMNTGVFNVLPQGLPLVTGGAYMSSVSS